MSRVRVLHVVSSLGIGGTEKSVETIVRSLDAKRFESTVWCLEELGVRGNRLRQEGHEGVTIHVGDVADLDQYLDADTPHIVHVHGDGRRDRVVAAATGADIPVVLKSTHFGMLRDEPERLPYDAYLFVSKMILYRYLVLSGASIDVGAWPHRHHLLYNPIDLDRIDPDSTDTLRDDFEIPPDVPLLGKIGRSAPAKWGTVNFDGFQQLTDYDDETEILLVNTPPEFRERFNRMGIDDRVHYAENIPLGDLGRFYNAIDVLAHSSAIGESLGYVLLEAMAHRVPVVVDSQPMRDNGQIELVTHGETGYVANTPKAYAKAILEILHHPTRASTFGAEARRCIEDTFSSDLVVKRLERVYSNLLLKAGAGEDFAPPLEPLDPEREREVMSRFVEQYERRLSTHYDGTNAGYQLELASWQFVKRTPVGRWQLYDILRKTHLGVKEYLPTKLG